MIRGKPFVLACAASLALACGQEQAPGPAAPAESAAAPAAAPEEAPPALEPVVDEKALAIVKRAGDFLRGQQSFAVTVENSYDTVQETGEKLEFGATRRLLIRRPDRIRVETEPRNGGDRVTTFDGKLITVLDVGENAYAQVQRAGSLDEAIDFVTGDLGIPLPLAELWRAEPSRDLTADLVAGYRVSTEAIDGTPCDLVFLRNPNVDGQFWIAQSGDPVLHRIVLTYRNEPGVPQMRASLRDWRFGADAPDASFTFRAPEGAERIQFVARPRQVAAEGQ
jgi:hypothetical protein